MPPKKLKVTPCQSLPYDEDKFISYGASERFKNRYSSRNGVPEREFEDPSEQFLQEIQERHWQVLCQQLDRANIPLIHEFYANFSERILDICTIRRVSVNCAREDFNRLLRVGNINDDEYQNLHPDYDEIISTLAVHGTRWNIFVGTITNFPFAALTPISRTWHLFISVRLLPSDHHSDITKNRTVLNFGIQRGIPIDVGHIILSNLTHLVVKSSTGGLVYPSIITQMCINSGVPTAVGEYMQSPRAPISMTLFRQMRPFAHGRHPTEDP